MIQISVFSMVVLILIIHTILSHLLNWVFRISLKDESTSTGFGIVIAILFELLIIISLIKYYLE